MLVVKQNIALSLFGQSYIGSIYLADIEMFAAIPHSKTGNFSNHLSSLVGPVGADRRNLLCVAIVLRVAGYALHGMGCGFSYKCVVCSKVKSGRK